MTPEQKKGEHGSVETKVVGGVLVNVEDGEEGDTKPNSKSKAKTKKEDTDDTYESWTKAELVAYMDENDIAHESSMTKAELIELMP